MSIIAYYQAIPEDSHLLRAALTDTEMGSALVFLPRYTRIMLAFHDSRRAFQQLAVEATVLYPGIATRHFSLGRNWDYLHYLLCERRRHNPLLRGTEPGFVPDDPIEQALFGAGTIGTGEQGHPARYLPASKVKSAANFLAQIDQETFIRYWDVPQMLKGQVYRASYYAAATTEEQLAGLLGLWELMTEFQAFYRLVAAHEEGMAILVD